MYDYNELIGIPDVNNHIVKKDKIVEAVFYHHYEELKGCMNLTEMQPYMKTSRELQTLPRENLIGCQGVKMFLLKDPFNIFLFFS